MLEVACMHRRNIYGHAGSGRNGNEAVAGAASEAFARLLHYQYSPVELHAIGAGHIVSPRDNLLKIYTYCESVTCCVITQCGPV